MDVSKYIKEKNNWIFDDTFKTDVVGVFVTAKDWLTNAGKKQDVMVLGIEGTDYLIMPFNLDYVEFVELYGTDTRLWEGHQFKLTRNKKNKYTLVSIEEKI